MEDVQEAILHSQVRMNLALNGFVNSHFKFLQHLQASSSSSRVRQWSSCCLKNDAVTGVAKPEPLSATWNQRERHGSMCVCESEVFQPLSSSLRPPPPTPLSLLSLASVLLKHRGLCFVGGLAAKRKTLSRPTSGPSTAPMMSDGFSGPAL